MKLSCCVAIGVLPLWSLLTETIAAQPYGLNTRPAIGPFLNGALPQTAPLLSGNWSTVVAFPNLTFINAVGLTHLPGTTRLVVWEREGRIYSFENNLSASTKTLMLNITNQCQGWDDSGLLGVAFHPGFVTNRYLFVWYTWVTPGTVLGNANQRPPTSTPNRDRLSRFTLDANGVAIAGTETVFIDQNSETVWHNGGGMFFGDDGFLYITNGDDARGQNNQRINASLHSGVLRIDVDRRGGGISHPPPRQPQNGVTANYYIPNDNPFVGQTGVLEEFFAIGLRSPHRMTFDPVSRRIFIGDVGEGSREEVSVIEPGEAALNFQWNRIEGLNGDLTPPYIGVNKRPIIDYSHSEGFAVIGGYVYRGQQFAADLGGKYIFGDNGSKRVWVLDESTTPASKVLLATMPTGSGPNSGNDYTGLSSFGLDASGEIYLCQMSSIGGRIYKLQRGGPTNQPLPRLLSQTGAFTNLATLGAMPGLIPYDVASPLWSDGAHKTRWMGVPTGTFINYSPTGEWTFPNGNVFVKHFELPVNDTNPAVRKRLETRLLVRDTNGTVYGATYKWRADGTDADLIDSAVTENIAITTAPVGLFTGQDIGGPALAGSTTPFAGGYQIVAGGVDIWNQSDQFHFAHQQRTGDFDVRVRIESLTQADLYTKAGLMVRESLAANSREVMAFVFPSNAQRNNNVGGYEFQYRATTGGGSTAIYPPIPQPTVSFPNTWLRLTRQGDTFAAYSSSDGVNWRNYANYSLDLPETVYFGLAVTAHTGGSITTARFHLGNTRIQPWFFPGRQDCLACHTPQSGGVLGVKTRQSNRDFHYASTGVTDNQLRTWNHIGLFNPSISESVIPNLDRLVPVTNTSASLEHRVRSYLDANCAHCHRPGAARAFWDARFDTPLEQQGIINGLVQNNLGIVGARNVVPGNPARSILHRRVNSVEPNVKMPPLAKNMIDVDAVTVLTEWILGLPLGLGPQVLVAQGSSWKFLDDGSDQGTAWRAAAFNDGEWDSGPAQLGYGDGDETTVVNGGPTGNRFATTYFRHEFQVTNAAAFTDLAVRLLRDDGAVAYLNGVEAFRENMPDGAITFATAASATIGNEDENAFVDLPVDPSLLVEGRNVLAVEIHQVQASSSDISFDLELSGSRRETTNSTPPTVALTSPSDGSVFAAPATILLAASASDGQGTVVKVEFFAGLTKLGEDAAAPFAFTFPEAMPGAYTFYAIATDNSGMTATSPVVHVTIASDNTPPTVTLAGPEEGAKFFAPANILLEAMASDSDGTVTKVEFYEGTTQLGEIATPPFRFVWNNVPVGTYSVRVVAIDNSGGSSQSPPVNVFVRRDPVSTNALIARGAVWKYLDDGSDQGSAWRGLGFDDIAWASGPAQLGYGDDDEATEVGFGGDPENKFITTYFRRALLMEHASAYTNLTLRVQRDDGVVVYLNGAEVFRENMPGGTISHTNRAVTTVNNENAFVGTNVPVGLLLQGTNIVAAEIHQANPTSSDLSFDLELVGISVAGEEPPLLHAEPMAAGQFRLWFEAGAGGSYVIEASNDLETWQPVATNSVVAGRVEFLDAVGGEGHRFYRARSAP